MKHFRIDDSTSGCLRRLDTVEKIGTVQFIRGYLRVDHRGVKRVSVMVHGTEGTARFDGFSWGYSGEGVRGLACLLDKLKVPEYQKSFALNHEWLGWDGPPREYWRINFHAPSRAAA